MRPLAFALLLPLASGCQHIVVADGAERLEATTLFGNLNVASDCVQGVDADTGLPTTSTHHTLTSSGDTATLHEAGGIFASALAFASKLIPLPVPPVGAPPPGRMGATPSPAGSPAVTSCAGERTTRTPAGQQQSDAAPAADEALQRRLELAARAADDTPEIEAVPGDGG